MKKVLIILVVLGVLLMGTIAIVNLLRFQSVKTVDQTNNPSNQPSAGASQTANDRVDRQGSFVDGDSIHHGRGTVTQVTTATGEKVLQFKDFNVTQGPDLFVYLSKNPNAAQDKKSGEFVSLGSLQKTSGDQVYILPDNASEYHAVFVWCRAFGVAFAVATLK